MAGAPIVDIRDIVVAYGEKTVLHNITAGFNEKEIRVILGTSGCGKTTLLKSIIGLLKPVSGEIRLFGELLVDTDTDEASRLLQRIGVLFQNGALLGSLTVSDNVALPLQMHTKLPMRVIHEIVQMKLEQVGLPHAAPLYPDELSGGMRKRAALARALVMEPPLLLCDEPSAGLDPVTSAGLDRLLLSLRKRLGITIVVVTHELFSIETIADQILYLHQGRVFFDGPLNEAKKADAGPLRDFFNRRETKQ